MLAKGFEIPSVEGIKFSDTEIRYGDGYLSFLMTPIYESSGNGNPEWRGRVAQSLSDGVKGLVTSIGHLEFLQYVFE